MIAIAFFCLCGVAMLVTSKLMIESKKPVDKLITIGMGFAVALLFASVGFAVLDKL
tara:strand:+ start:337 stop:504 length:168 start_codon:yes stop_codon:yes gene_type:complete